MAKKLYTAVEAFHDTDIEQVMADVESFIDKSADRFSIFEIKNIQFLIKDKELVGIISYQFEMK